MPEWLHDNIANILIVTGVVMLVFFAVRKIISDKRAGKCPCGGDCSGCALSGQCHSKDRNIP